MYAIRLIILLNRWFVCILLFSFLLVVSALFYNKQDLWCSSTLYESDLDVKKQSYDCIFGPAFFLKKGEYDFPFPKLNEEILFYGFNKRVDRVDLPIYLGLKGSDHILSVYSGDLIYLYYDHGENKYCFSEGNEVAPLWIEPIVKDNLLNVQLGVVNEQNRHIKGPNFTLYETNYFRNSGKTWKLKEFPVDATILVRQHARWFGEDLFMKMHGGEEFAYCDGRQRIEFGEGEEKYCCFVDEGDALVWEGDRWREIGIGEKSRGYPLLYIKKLDKKLMHLELFDVDGKVKINSNLIKMNSISNTSYLLSNAKLLSAQTWQRFILEIGEERIQVKPRDWLFHDNNGWRKLVTKEDINLYVLRHIEGELLILDKIARKRGRQVLLGHIFNAMRTEVHYVELEVNGGIKISDNFVVL